MSEKKTAAVVLTLATLLCYANGFDGTFHYDDHHSIKDNSALRSLDNSWRSLPIPSSFLPIPTRRCTGPCCC